MSMPQRRAEGEAWDRIETRSEGVAARDSPRRRSGKLSHRSPSVLCSVEQAHVCRIEISAPEHHQRTASCGSLWAEGQTGECSCAWLHAESSGAFRQGSYGQKTPLDLSRCSASKLAQELRFFSICRRQSCENRGASMRLTPVYIPTDQRQTLIN